MDLLDRLLAHDAWTTALLLRHCHALSDEQLDAAFDIGPRSVRATLVHMVSNVEMWADLMAGRPVGAVQGRPPWSVEEIELRHANAVASLAAIGREVARAGNWDGLFIDTLDDPPTRKSFGGGLAHVATHNMHHRAQLLYMLRQLGVQALPEGDVLTWEGLAGSG